MALTDGQAQIRDLLLGPGTPYRLLGDTNPWSLMVRADQGGKRAWNHGAWSGAEWADEKVVPITVAIDEDNQADWLDKHQQLAAAFAPVGDTAADVEFRFGWGGREYLLFGRPRMVEPRVRTAGSGKTITEAAFVALDPRIYDGAESISDPVPLPQQAGGTLVPTLVPLLVSGTILGGSVDLLNEGTTAAPLFVRIDGPVDEPRFTLQRPDGSVQSVRFAGLILPIGQWIEIDTAASTALFNGLPGSSVFGQTIWDIDPYPLLPGTTVLRFGAAEFNDQATLTSRHRSSWW